MNKNVKRNFVFVVIIVIIIILLWRTCGSSNDNGIDTVKMVNQDSVRDTLVENLPKKANQQSTKTVLNTNEKLSFSTDNPSPDTDKLVFNNLNDTISSIASSKKNLLVDTAFEDKRDTLVSKEDKVEGIDKRENQASLKIHVQKSKQDTLSGKEYVEKVRSFFSNVIINFEGLDKNNNITNQIKDITYFKVFVKMSTQQPLNDNFKKKIFVRISDSTTGKLIAFKGLSTMMQSITLYNMQEIDYILAQQANFNNQDKSSMIEKTFERLNSFKPKNNITVRTEVFCQGVKIGEKMTSLLIEKKN